MIISGTLASSPLRMYVNPDYRSLYKSEQDLDRMKK